MNMGRFLTLISLIIFFSCNEKHQDKNLLPWHKTVLNHLLLKSPLCGEYATYQMQIRHSNRIDSLIAYSLVLRKDAISFLSDSITEHLINSRPSSSHKKNLISIAYYDSLGRLIQISEDHKKRVKRIKYKDNRISNLAIYENSILIDSFKYHYNKYDLVSLIEGKHESIKYTRNTYPHLNRVFSFEPDSSSQTKFKIEYLSKDSIHIKEFNSNNNYYSMGFRINQNGSFKYLPGLKYDSNGIMTKFGDSDVINTKIDSMGNWTYQELENSATIREFFYKN